MKLDRYRKIITKIDTDKSCDDKIKNELIFCEFEEENEQRFFMGKEKTVIKEYPFSSLHKFSFVGRILTSVAFLAILIGGLALYQIHLRATMQTNNDLSTAYITQVPEENKPEAIEKSTTKYTTKKPNGNTTSNTTKDTSKDSVDSSKYSAEDTSKNSANEITQNTIEVPSNNSEVTKDTKAPTSDNQANSNQNSNSVNEAKNTSKSTSKQTTKKKNNTEVTDDSVKAKDFYFAIFDVINDKNVKASIPNLIVRFHGTIKSINKDDFTDIVLTRDGVPIKNGIKLTKQIKQCVWRSEEVTDFYFKFTTNNTEPGTYGLTGKYKGVPFTVDKKIIEAEITKEAAHSEDLTGVSFGGYTNELNEYTKITEVSFAFQELQNTFYVSNLTEIKVTCNGVEIPFSFVGNPFRYHEVFSDNTEVTFFNLVLKDGFTDSGVYVITGKYQGVPFESSELVIP